VSTASSHEPTATLAAYAYPPPLRFARAGLLAVSGGVLPFLLYRVLVATDPPVTPDMLVRSIAAFALLPWLAAWLVGRALRAVIEVGPAELVVRVGGQTVTAPLASIAGVEPWRLPLPQPGLVLRLGSGARFPLGLAAREPGPIVAALAAAGVSAAQDAARHPTLVYARARARAGAWRWWHLAVKYPMFALLPAGVLFNAHQYIAYGGTWGQWYLEGPLPWLQTALVYWLTVTVYLVLYASAWRGVTEAASLVAALGGEAQALRARRLAELVGRVAYYAGVPLLLALRFAQ
jgi:hypothetical protein